MNKRQQARNERDLQELITSVSGNDRCADCQARNPGWASWSLGIFLCMRCAALHRKLGTHISKVKSLSMDNWSTDQVEAMRQNGNVSVNKIYNPKNVKPGIPLDVDEVDSAMERFIRQKYKERSLADGKPRPPSRDDVTLPSRTLQPSPPVHLQPTKKGKIFGFKLRASSAAYPASKRDIRNLPPLEPTVENAFRTEVQSNKPSKTFVADSSERDTGRDEKLDEKLATLREMGFLDDKRNSSILSRLSGDLGRTVESLVRLGDRADSRKTTPVCSGTNTPLTATFPDSVKGQGGQEPATSKNPFDQATRSHTLTVPQVQRHQTTSYNPFDVQAGPQSAFQPIDQAFQAMQISQPLFPHSTGGYPQQQPPVQDLRFQHSMTPPVPQISQQYGYTTSPSTMYSTNPFLQSTQSATIYDSYPTLQHNAPFSAPATNPFFNQQSSYLSPQSPPQSAPLQFQNNTSSNPFGIPPSPHSPHSSQFAPANQPHNVSPFDIPQGLPSSDAQQQSFYTEREPQSHFSPQMQGSIPTLQQASMPYQPSLNPYQSQLQPQASPQYPSQQSPLRPQQTGRFDKNSILALYNYPHLAPQPMPTILDDPTLSTESPSAYAQAASPAHTIPSNTPPTIILAPARRSVTMPASAPFVSNLTLVGVGSRNPFLHSSPSSDTSRQSSTVTSPAVAHAPLAPKGIMHRHVSQESVSISNLDHGRHSPDAFAHLSARFVR